MTNKKTLLDLDDNDDDENDDDYIPKSKTSQNIKTKLSSKSLDETELKKEEIKKRSLDNEEEDVLTKKKLFKEENTEKKSQDLWSSFLKDVGTTQSSNKTTEASSPVPEKNSIIKMANNDKINKPKTSGLSGLLDKISKPGKISTLEKSRLDWMEFKKEENIEDDLKIYSRGKESYLDRKAFLERTDLRQFEIEKEYRNKERTHRDSK